MPRLSFAGLVGASLLVSCFWVKLDHGQTVSAKSAETAQLPPIAMSPDRAADSYRIYSMLMPVGELGARGWPHDLYLLEDKTVTLVQPDEPCWQQAGSPGSVWPMNPHNALHAPADRAQDLAELLEDFDRHCHERIQLTTDGFKLNVPLRLLNETEQNEFRKTRLIRQAPSELQQKYKGAPGLSAFSQVYFNTHHTVAMVYASGWCGSLCAQSFWAAFELDKTGQWKSLGWNSTNMMS